MASSQRSNAAADLLKQLAQCSYTLDSNQRWELKVLTEAGKAVLEDGARQLVRDAGGLPLLCYRSCDGTPLSVHFRKSVELKFGPAGSKKRQISGKSAKEILVKNEFLRCQFPGGKWVTKIALKEPVSLDFDKSVPSILAVCAREWLTLRQRGHAGPAVEHYVFDRAGYTALERITRQMHAEIAGGHQGASP